MGAGRHHQHADPLRQDPVPQPKHQCEQETNTESVHMISLYVHDQVYELCSLAYLLHGDKTHVRFLSLPV